MINSKTNDAGATGTRVVFVSRNERMIMRNYTHRSRHVDDPRWRDHARSFANVVVIWFLVNAMAVPTDPPARRRASGGAVGCSAALANPSVRAGLERKARIVLALVTAWLASLGVVAGVG